MMTHVLYLTLMKFQRQLLMIALWMTSGWTVIAQTPVGTIDFYGTAKVNRDSLLKYLTIREDEPLKITKTEVEQKLLAVPGIKQADASQLCCVQNKTSLFIGVFEEENRNQKSGDAYNADIKLPDTINSLYDAYFNAFQKAVAAGNAQDDFSKGHSLMSDSATRSIQQKFVPVANKNFNLLTSVLLTSKDVEERATAAFVIAYANAKQEVVTIYKEAIRDPNALVRNNVVRALSGFAAFAQENPGKLNLDGSIVIPLLNSVYWLDRDKAMFFLVPFTQKRDKKIIAAIKKQALPALVEMANWKSEGYAYMAYILLGRIADVKEDDIHSSWQSKNRKLVFDAVGTLQSAK